MLRGFPAADCPAGFQAIAGSCVQVLDRSATYQAAVSACASFGGRLATVRDRGVWELFKRIFAGIDADLWIGKNSHFP